MPAAGAQVEVLTVGSGSLLLVRLPGGRSEPVALLGAGAPKTSQEYEANASLRERDERNFARSLDDKAWTASLQHLAKLLEGAKLTIHYPATGAGRDEEGSLAAYVVAEPAEGEAFDLNGAMIRDGYALASGKHERLGAYRLLEAAARAAGRGLFGE